VLAAARILITVIAVGNPGGDCIAALADARCVACRIDFGVCWSSKSLCSIRQLIARCQSWAFLWSFANKTLRRQIAMSPQGDICCGSIKKNGPDGWDRGRCSLWPKARPVNQAP